MSDNKPFNLALHEHLTRLGYRYDRMSKPEEFDVYVMADEHVFVCEHGTAHRHVPYNPAAHEYLISCGYEYDRIDADWEDIGTGETGPMLRGHNGYDEYVGDTEFVFITAEGEADFELRDLQFEQWMSGHGDESIPTVH